MTLENRTHISWWPKTVYGRDGQPLGGVPFKPSPGEVLTLEHDIKSEGRSPDRIIKVDGLDEVAIQKWWDNFGQNNKEWEFFGQNCAKTIADGLTAGGGWNRAFMSGSTLPVNFIWTPSNVANYATAIRDFQKGARREFPSSCGLCQ